MNKGGGYVLTAYMLEIIGPDEVLTTYLCDSVRRSLTLHIGGPRKGASLEVKSMEFVTKRKQSFLLHR